MRTIIILIASCMVVACMIKPMQNKGILIEKVMVREVASSKRWVVTDVERVRTIQAVFEKVAPARKAFLDRVVTYGPLDYDITLHDSEGVTYFFQLSETQLRNHEATWAISEHEYKILMGSVGNTLIQR